VPGDYAKFVRNESYWDPGKPYIDTIIVRSFATPDAMIPHLEAGTIDWIQDVPLSEYKRLSETKGIKVASDDQYLMVHLNLNVRRKPFDNKKVRQALAWATPYQDIIDKVYYGHARRMTSIVPDIYAGYTPTYAYQYDLTKAKNLLAEAGYPDGFDVSLAYNASQKESEEMSILLKSSWEQIGVRVTLQSLPTAVWAEQKYGKKLQAFAENEQWPWSGDPGYSSWVYLGNGPDNFINAVNFNNAEYNQLLEKAMRMLDSPEREAITKKLQEIVADEVPWIQVAWFDWTVAAKKDLTGFVWTPDDQIRFAYLKR
jgi:peptide/nickel transport system substrate-binding protein